MGTIIIFLLLLPIALVAVKVSHDHEAQQRRQGKPVPQGLSAPQVVGLVGGVWAAHEMFQDLHRSERIGEDIEQAQFWAQGHETFGSPEYYRAESEYLHHRR